MTLISSHQHCNGGAVTNGDLGNKINVETCGQDCINRFGNQIKFLTFRKIDTNNVNGECFCESTLDCKQRSNRNLDFIYSVQSLSFSIFMSKFRFCVFTRSRTFLLFFQLAYPGPSARKFPFDHEQKSIKNLKH